METNAAMTLEVPADPEWVELLAALASSFAPDLPMDDAADLALAVEEAASAVLIPPATDRLRCELRRSASGLDVSLVADPTGSWAGLGPRSRQVLGKLTNQLEVTTGPQRRIRFSFPV